jgi:hypothetical protein
MDQNKDPTSGANGTGALDDTNTFYYFAVVLEIQ